MGLACRETEKRLRAAGIRLSMIRAVFLSHEHDDHARSAFRFAARHRVPIYATQGSFRAGRARFAQGKGKGKDVEWVRIRAGQSVKLGGMAVESFPTPHDAAEPVGFRFREGRLVFAHVTDIGHISRSVEEGLEGAEVVLIESNHDLDMLSRGPYPESLKQRVGSRLGHLSNEALAFYLEMRLPETARHLFLAHLSRTNNHESLALASCREALGRRGGARPTVHLTYHDRATPMLRVREARRVEPDERQGVLRF